MFKKFLFVTVVLSMVLSACATDPSQPSSVQQNAPAAEEVTVATTVSTPSGAIDTCEADQVGNKITWEGIGYTCDGAWWMQDTAAPASTTCTPNPWPAPGEEVCFFPQPIRTEEHDGGETWELYRELPTDGLWYLVLANDLTLQRGADVIGRIFSSTQQFIGIVAGLSLLGQLSGEYSIEIPVAAAEAWLSGNTVLAMNGLTLTASWATVATGTQLVLLTGDLMPLNVHTPLAGSLYGQMVIAGTSYWLAAGGVFNNYPTDPSTLGLTAEDFLVTEESLVLFQAAVAALDNTAVMDPSLGTLNWPTWDEAAWKHAATDRKSILLVALAYEIISHSANQLYFSTIQGRVLVSTVDPVAGAMGAIFMATLDAGANSVGIHLGNPVTVYWQNVGFSVEQVRISGCFDWRIVPLPVEYQAQYSPPPTGIGRCLENGNAAGK